MVDLHKYLTNKAAKISNRLEISKTSISEDDYNASFKGLTVESIFCGTAKEVDAFLIGMETMQIHIREV